MVSEEEDLAAGPGAGLVTQELFYSRVLKWKGTGKTSDTDIRKGWRVSPSLVSARELYTLINWLLQ